MHSEVTRTALRQNITERQRTKIGHQTRGCVRKTYRMMKGEIPSPFDVNISGIVCVIRLEVGCYQYELFLNQQIYLQTRPMLRRVHDRDINESGRYVRDQILGNVDMNAERYVRM